MVRTLASHQCGLEVPLDGELQTESVDDGHDSAFTSKDCVSLGCHYEIAVCFQKVRVGVIKWVVI